MRFTRTRILIYLLCLASGPGLRAEHSAMPSEPVRSDSGSFSAAATVGGINPERQERRARVTLIKAGRENARAQGNVLVGLDPTLVLFPDVGQGDDASAYQFLPAMGISLGYRTHFLRRWGIHAESQLFLGPTYANMEVDTSTHADTVVWENFFGGAGTTTGLAISTQLILGPFGRAVFEPGIGITEVWRSASRLRLESGDDTRSIRLVSRQLILNGMLGAGVYLGDRDQFNLNGTWKFGWDSRLSGLGMMQWQLNLAYAFQMRGFGN